MKTKDEIDAEWKEALADVEEKAVAGIDKANADRKKAYSKINDENESPAKIIKKVSI